MRYANRTARAIDLVGGPSALLKAMRKNEVWGNPERTLETWLERKKISSDGMLFIWEIADAADIRLKPQDFSIYDIKHAVQVA